MTHSRDTIVEFANALIEEGMQVRATAVQRPTSSITSDWFVAIEPFEKWRTSCKVLLTQLGSFADPWDSTLNAERYRNNRPTVDTMLGVLKSITENVADGRLARFEDIVFAEAFSNLLEQAEYLLEKGYFLAAGVLFRAILEEKLRRLCDTAGCIPQKNRPTIADYNQALYKTRQYDKITFKSVDEMSAVGNDAAHNKPTLQVADVERLRTNLTDFLRRH